jgi:hypothetical protein
VIAGRTERRGARINPGELILAEELAIAQQTFNQRGFPDADRSAHGKT